jgi:hypothetical protein
MKITGQQIADGVNAWIADELKTGPSREYDLGKFLFTVGTGTIGFLLVAVKVDRATATWNLPLTMSLLFLVMAIGISIIMVQPKKWAVEEDTDLFAKRAEIIRRIVYESRSWFIVWVLGLLCGVWGVFY